MKKDNAVLRILGAVDLFIDRLARYGLLASVLVILFLSVSIIVLRWFQVTFLWFDPLVRHLVFLSTFFGGVVATGRGTHIGIDILGRYFEGSGHPKAKLYVERLINFVTSGVLIWLTVTSFDFISMEFKYGKEDFLGIHSGFLVSIIPFGFSLLAYRFVYRFLFSFTIDIDHDHENAERQVC